MGLTVTKFRSGLADIRQLAKPIAEGERHQYDIRDVKEGGFLRIDGYTYIVLEVSRYTEKRGKYEWFELKIRNVKTGLELFVEWEFDDELEIWLNRKLSFRSLPINQEWVNDVWEEDDDGASFSHAGTTYQIEEWDDGKYYRHNGREVEEFRFFDFLSEDETSCIGIEIWDGEFEASFGETLNPARIEVLALEGK